MRLFLIGLILIAGTGGCERHITDSGADSGKHRSMIEEQIIKRGVTDKAVIDAMMNVKRHQFVPEDMRSQAYEDHPLPIGFDQTISQPYIVAYMTELLQPDRQDKVLEIGTGSGYQAAVLAEIVSEVYTIEIVPQLAHRSAALLKDMGYSNVYVRHGDGYKGWEEHAPYDAIILTAAPSEIPQPLKDQLAVGGTLVAPVGQSYQKIIRLRRTENGFEQEDLIPVRFVPMVKEVR